MKRRQRAESWKQWLKARAPFLITYTVLFPLGVLYAMGTCFVALSKAGRALQRWAGELATKTGIARRVQEWLE